MAMRTVRPRFTDRAVVSFDWALSSIHCLVKPLGTASRIVPSMSPSGRAERSIDVATGPSSSVGTALRAAAHARVRESDSTATSGQNNGEFSHAIVVICATLLSMCSVARPHAYAQTGDGAVENYHRITRL